MDGSALRPELRMRPVRQGRSQPPWQPSMLALCRHRGHPEAGLVPLTSWRLGERFGLGRPEGSRRCAAVGERVSVVAGVDCEGYWTQRPNGQGCLMGLAAIIQPEL